MNEDIDGPPPVPPAIVQQIDAQDFDERNAFHHFLRYFHIEKPGRLENHKDIDVRLAFLLLHQKFFKDLWEQDGDPETDDWTITEGFLKKYGKYIEKLGGRLSNPVS